EQPIWRAGPGVRGRGFWQLPLDVERLARGRADRASSWLAVQRIGRSGHSARRYDVAHVVGFGMSLEKESMLPARRSFVVIAAIAASSLAMLAPLSGQRDQSPPPQAPMPAVLRSYQPVTADRLKNPEDSNWLMVRRTYDGWGYSSLDQITPANVNRLRPVWVFSTGEARVHESPPIVNNGAMFVTTPNGQVIAIDAKSGTLLWRYRRPRPPGALVPHETNRGVALYGDKVFYGAGEAALVALDARTGRELWATTVADNKSAYYVTLAPLVADGKVMVGASGGEFGIRGFVAAFDPETGKELWRTYT